MAISRENLDNYRKNLWCLQDAADQLLGTMKGYTSSFRTQITGRNGKLDPKMLEMLVDEMLSIWADQVRNGIYPDKHREESAAEPYLDARQELYRLYLSLTMQCSLCTGAFAIASREDEEDRERPDYAYLMEHAKAFSRAWCVLEDPDGTRHNMPYQGFDAHFGFHLFHTLSDPEDQSGDTYLTPSWKNPAQDLSRLTNLGNVKRIHCKQLSPPHVPETAPEETAAPEDQEEEDEWDPYADFGDPEDYDPFEDSWDSVEMPIGVSAIQPEDIDETDRTSWILAAATRLGGHEDEYIEACKRFVSLYEAADPNVLRGFYEDLEEIVDLYLLQKGLSSLTNTDNTLDVYCRLSDGALQQAKRYARGLLWKRL